MTVQPVSRISPQSQRISVASVTGIRHSRDADADALGDGSWGRTVIDSGDSTDSKTRIADADGHARDGPITTRICHWAPRPGRPFRTLSFPSDIPYPATGHGAELSPTPAIRPKAKRA